MMKPRTPNQILDEIAEQQIHKEIDLSSSILNEVRKEKRNIMKSRLTLYGAAGLALVLVILFSAPSVATAMKRLLGYIPGVGLVEENALLRLLESPVQARQGDTTITVVQGVIDAQQTTLLYQVENIPASPAGSVNDPTQMCGRLPELLLPDGSLLEGRVSSGNSWVNGYSRRIVFPALPKDVNTAVLVFTCLEQTVPTADAPKWKLALNFVEAPDDMAVYPLIDLPTPTPAPAEEAPSEPTPQETDEAANAPDLRLNVNRYIQTDENIILFGSLESQSAAVRVEMVESTAIHLRDADGNDIPLEEADPAMDDPESRDPGGASFRWAYQTAGRYSPGQATLTVDSAWIGLNVENVGFTFDPGPNPQPNQEWELNQPLVVAGRRVIIQSAQMNKTGDSLNFTMEVPEDIGGVVLHDPDHAILGGGGGPTSSGFTYRDGFPSGTINIVVAGISLIIPGPWQATVDLPALANSSQAAELPEACLTYAAWRAALQAAPALPEGLNSMLVLADVLEPDYQYHVLTSNLDGTQQQVLTLGDGGSLSPDKSRIIFNSNAGLQMMDLASGAATPLQGTGKNDRDALWSPDGTKIAFTRGPVSGLIGAPGPYSLYLANPDGSDQQPLLVNADTNTAQAWAPDGQSLLYSVAGPDGASVRRINIATGQITPLFEVNYLYPGAVVSPDGKRVAYQAMLPGDRYGIFVANLNGSDPKLIADAAPIVITHPQWSPDGKWIIASVHDEQISSNSPALALIEVDTCQIIPLPSIKGYVTSWRQ
jgi:Tol biopolymer transport system component